MSKVSITLPIKTVSEFNVSEHWTKKSERHRHQQLVVRVAFRQLKEPIIVPCSVRLIRLSSRFLDDDNLRGAFKWIRDELSECILPQHKAHYVKNGNLVPLKGRLDSHPAITWLYEQRKEPKAGILIEIENA